MTTTASTASRRAFLSAAGRLSLLGSAAPFALNLAAIGAASAQSAGDYKALVCVFLYGGNDSANTVMPYEQAAYGAYRNARSTIARNRDVLVPLRTSGSNTPLALPPELAALAQRYNDGQAAIVANVGPLVQPTTRAQYLARSVALPPKLFSHNDQQSVWQASAPEGAQFGWGGRIGDLLASSNGNPTFTCMSVAGNAVFLAGQATTQYQITPAGAIAIDPVARSGLFGSAAAPGLLGQLISQQRTNKLEADYTAVTRRSRDAQQQMATAVGGVNISTPFPAENPLGAQLKMVARSIAARAGLGARRQVFFVSMGGFDHHAGLNAGHPALLRQLGDGLDAFYRATVELGVQNQVTTFTASDFGRALSSNGDGSDHGWGGHHFVLGGAVKGGAVYGQFPDVALGTVDDAGQGRLIPTTAVDQYAAGLARWMGLSPSQALDVLPNLGRFSTTGMDFVA